MDFTMAPGRRVQCNLEGKTIGGVLFTRGQTAIGTITVVDAMGVTLKVKLDEPVGGGVPHGVLKRKTKPDDMVSLVAGQVTLLP